MTLTGLPLIVLTAVLTVLVGAATVLLWSRFGRWRLLSRAAGVLLAEVLVVATLGLIFNRADDFYPSWQALRGDTGTASATVPPPRGRLDATLTGTESTLRWRPAGLASWRLAATPTVVLPAGYRDQPSVVYPVLLVLTGSPAEAAAAMRSAVRADGVVTVVATPGAATTAAALARLGGDLGGDVRVMAYGWGLVATTRFASLAGGLVGDSPGRYAGVAWIGPIVPAGVGLNGSVAVALVRAAAAGHTTTGRPPAGATVVRRPPAGKPASRKSPVGKAAARKAVSRVATGRPVQTVLTCPPGSVWAVAGRWAAGQTPRPLRPAVRLPAAAR